MADRYWVGWSAVWNDTAWTKRALTSWWTGGEAVPTSVDNVFFDANSWAVAVTGDYAWGWSFKSLDCTWYTGSLTHWAAWAAYPFGDITLSNTMGSLSMPRITPFINSAKWNITIKSFWKTLWYIALRSVDTLTLDWNLTMWELKCDDWWIVNIWDYDLTASSMGHSFSWDSATLIFWSGTLNTSNFWYISSITKWTWTIKCTWDFDWVWLVYNNIELNWATSTISWNNTFNDLKIWKDWAQTISFTDWTDQTVTTFTCVWDVGKVKTLQWTGTVWRKLSDTTGTNTCDYLSVKNSTVEWWATRDPWANSVNLWHNKWWLWWWNGKFVPKIVVLSS